jgi:hypothetical protein
MISTSAKVLQWWRYAAIKSTQVPYTYSVSQPLAYHVYLWRNWHPKIAEIDGYIAGLDVSLRLSPKLPPKSFNDGGMPASSPHRYPTHIRSRNHWNDMCICEAIGIHKSFKFTCIHTVSTFHCFYALNFRQRSSMMEICRNQVHTGIAHIFCLTTTSIPCVFVKQ